jgi:ABC-type Fe3+/spermidine/putrescine transport system ATPase subunit
VLQGKASGGDRVALGGGATVQVAAGRALRAGEELDLAIRPERVRLATGPGDNVVEARIEALVYQGSQTDVTARLADGQRVLVFVVEPAPLPLAAGQTVHLFLPADAFMVLTRAGAPA